MLNCSWLPLHAEAILSIKDLACVALVLKFYGVNREVTTESCAFLSGLGASLLQEGQPGAFSSRALTPTESPYTQIEKALLFVVFACERPRFDTYMYGRDARYVLKQIISPLKLSLRKDLGSACKRLQMMLVSLQRYNLDVK